MGIQNFPATLQPIIQADYLERAFQQGLRSKLMYRSVADRETFSTRVGETITKTRAGLKNPVITPMVPSTNSNFDNGMTPSGWSIEQYSLGIAMYGDTIDLNMVTEKVGLASQFVQNSLTNGIQASQSLERLARNALYGSYLSGNTSVRTTLGAPGTSLAVDDIRGFQSVWVNGVPTSVSGSNTLLVTVNGVAATVIAATADGTNVSTTPGGISGVLTTSANVSVANGTALNAVVASNAATIIRPGAKTSAQALASGDLLTMSTLLDTVAVLRKNGVPDIGGFYNAYLDPVSARQLFADADFKLLFRGGASSPDYKNGMVSDFLGLRFLTTTEAILQQAGSVTIRRPIICGKGAIIEGTFAGQGASDVARDEGVVSEVDGVVMVTREPLDRLQQIIAQSWYWIGGYAVPTDTTVNTNIIPTATNSAFKRAVVIEHAS